MARKKSESAPLEPRQFRTPEEIDLAIAKLDRRIKEIENLDVGAAITRHTGADDAARSNVRETILEIFGTNSPEFNEHQHLQLWSGPMFMGMSDYDVIEGTRRGCTVVAG